MARLVALAEHKTRVAVTNPGFQSLTTPTINATLQISNLRTRVRRRLVLRKSTSGRKCYLRSERLWTVHTLPRSVSLQSLICRNPRSHRPRPVIYQPKWKVKAVKAFRRLTSVQAQLVDDKLGLDHFLEKDDDALWDRLRSQLQILLREFKYPITHLVLAGESVTHPRFLDILRGSYQSILLLLRLVVRRYTPEGGKQVQRECAERSHCEEKRMRERLYTSTQEGLRSTREELC
ncbi:Cytochrome P450 [Penicillium sp. IBT 31633x]|nr:Cytochrome P450 [Penicillium sp. IBT 31633x]